MAQTNNSEAAAAASKARDHEADYSDDPGNKVVFDLDEQDHEGPSKIEG